MDGRRSDTALSTKTLKEMIGKEQLVRSKSTEELNSLFVSLFLSSFLVFSLDLPFSISSPVPHSDGAIYRGFRGERAP